MVYASRKCVPVGTQPTSGRLTGLRTTIPMQPASNPQSEKRMPDAPTGGSPRSNGSVHNSPRRWLLPPTLFRDPDAPESFEGVSILQEIPGDLGLALYQLYRDLLLWALVPDDSRPGLFRPGAPTGRDRLIDTAAPSPELRIHLETLASFLRSQAFDSAAATDAALRISRWAAGCWAGTRPC